MKLRTSLFSSLVGVSVAMGGVVVPQAFADTPAQCANPEITIESGTLKWGIKQSWRGYVSGPIARGDWTVTGATDNGKAKGASDFQFHFDVNPSGTVVTFNPDGTVKNATIKTVPSTLKFKGHHGALESTMKSPYIETFVEGGKTVVRPGVTYEGYYVEGKEMADYKPSDRTPENFRTGTDTFAQGNSNGWVLEGDTLKLDATGMTYVPKPGTQTEAGKKTIIEGVDIIFMGIYSASYKPEMDDVNVELKVKKTCPQVAPPKPTTEAPKPPAPKPTTEAPKPPASTPTTSAPKPTTSAPKPPAPKPTTSAPKPPAPKPTTSEAPKPKPKDDWKKILFGILGAVGILAVIGGIIAALQQFNLIPGLKLPKF